MYVPNYYSVILFQKSKICELTMEERTKHRDLKGYHKAKETFCLKETFFITNLGEW